MSTFVTELRDLATRLETHFANDPNDTTVPTPETHFANDPNDTTVPTPVGPAPPTGQGIVAQVPAGTETPAQEAAEAAAAATVIDRGTWSAGTSYSANDTTVDPANGLTYLATVTSPDKSVSPSASTTGEWRQVAPSTAGL